MSSRASTLPREGSRVKKSRVTESQAVAILRREAGALLRAHRCQRSRKIDGTGEPGSRAPHALAPRIDERLAHERRCAALAEDLQFEAAPGGRERCRDVAERDRFSDAMPIAARSDPAYDLSVVPYRLVADRVGVASIDDERDKPPRRARRAIAQHRVAASAGRFRDVDEAIQPGLPRRIQRAILARPVAEALLEAQ